MKGSQPTWPLFLLLFLAVAFQNFWMWDSATLVFGLPINLLYHVGLCAAASVGMAIVVRLAWPRDLDED